MLYSRVRSWPYPQTKTKLERPTREKHSSLIWKTVNYDSKKFYNTGPRSNGEKRQLESFVHTKRAEIDDLLRQTKNAEEKAKKAMVDAGRLVTTLLNFNLFVN